MAIKIILSLIVSYLTGAVPTAYIFARLLKGIDIRKVGSGNVGATNAMRALGPVWGIVILLIDVAKGMICPWLVADFFIGRQELFLIRIILGVTAIIGHNWTIFLQFKGGKGVAVTLGMLAGLSFRIPGLGIVLALSLGVWLLVFVTAKIVSIASIIAAAFFPVFAFFLLTDRRIFVLGILLAVLLIYRHNSNIIKLLRKEEPPINLFKIRRPS